MQGEQEMSWPVQTTQEAEAEELQTEATEKDCLKIKLKRGLGVVQV